jgi:hypothetical protein
MTTATMERKKAVATFIATSHNLRVVFKPRRNTALRDVSGAVVAQPEVPVKELPAQRYLLDYNRTEELAAGAEDREANLIDLEALPPHVDFKSQKFETDDPNVALALRVHPNLNHELAGYHERYPTAEERLSEITRLAARGDVEGIRALLATEGQQGNHESVLAAGETALAALDTEAVPEGEAKGETAEAGSTDDSSEEPHDGPPDGEG